MAKPEVTFFVELDAPALEKLFSEPGLVELLADQGFGVSIGLRDLSKERAQVIRKLNASTEGGKRGIPVHAWLLLPEEEGYWFNALNYRQAQTRYRAFREWAKQEGLRFERVGLDIEPPIQEMRALAASSKADLLRYLWRKWHNPYLAEAKAAYQALVAEIQADGYPVDAYHMPFIADERRANSTVLARLGGLIDVPADREVFMLYSSFVRSSDDPYRGPAFIVAYGADTDAIALGSTGGGVDVAAGRTLTWEQLQQDLLTAAKLSDAIFIFSLEGCVQQGYLERLANLDWSAPVSIPPESLERARFLRRLIQGLLWSLEHLRWIIAGFLFLIAGGLLWRYQRKSATKS